MSSGEVKVGSVKVGDRHRTELGDIDALMASMREIGSLLQPIVLDKDLHLVAGFRRLEAAKRLGWATISARIVNGLDDAVKALHAERDENTCRKDFTPSELVSMGLAIAAVEAPQAAERQRLGTLASNEAEVGRTDEKVAEALGTSRASYQRAKAVVAAAEDDTHPAHAAAVDARAAMDAGEMSINGAAERVRSAKRRAAIDKVAPLKTDKSRAAVAERRERVKALAARGYDSDQIAKELGVSASTVAHVAKELGVTLWVSRGFHRKVDPNVVMENTTNDLAGTLETVLSLLDGRYGAIDPAKVDGWISSLENTRKSLNRLMSNLKEKTRD